MSMARTPSRRFGPWRIARDFSRVIEALAGEFKVGG
jgi:hypothetical protein